MTSSVKRKKKFTFNDFLAKMSVKRLGIRGKTVLAAAVAVLIFAVNYFAQQWAEQVKQGQTIIEPNPLLEPFAAPPAPQQRETAPSVPGPESALPAEKEEKKSIFRDPFQPFQDDPSVSSQKTARRNLSGIRVSGIVFDKTTPSAIINNKVVKIGDIVSGMTVVDIEADKIVMMEEGIMYILEFKK